MKKSDSDFETLPKGGFKTLLEGSRTDFGRALKEVGGWGFRFRFSEQESPCGVPGHPRHLRTSSPPHKIILMSMLDHELGCF